jgi:transposase
MKKDARTLSREILEEKRRMAHQLRKRGMTRAEIGEIVEVHADTVGRWLKLDEKNLRVNRGGRKVGDSRQLTPDQEKSIQKN